MRIRVALPDLVSNSYFPALAAVELGFFREEGLDAHLEHIFPVPATFAALRDGDTELVATSAHGPLWAFPRWQGAKILCSLSQGMYWFLVVRKDLPIKRGDLQGLKGLRLGAAPGIDVTFRALLRSAGIDPEADGISIGLPPGGVPKGSSFGVAAAAALIAGEIDGFWANGMGAEVAVTSGIAKCILDVRRGDGPPAAFHFTQPALMTTDTFISDYPDAAKAAIRAIVKTHQALKADTALATRVGETLFPTKEAKLIAALVERDLPFYDARVHPELIDGMNDFASGAGLLDGPPVAMEEIVAMQFRECWT